MTSKTRERSGASKTPKLERWASPQSCTFNPEFGLAARSAAMIAAPPRKNGNAEATIRPWRIGTSSGTRVASWRSSVFTGSGRFGPGSHSTLA